MALLKFNLILINIFFLKVLLSFLRVILKKITARKKDKARIHEVFNMIGRKILNYYAYIIICFPTITNY